MPPTNVSEHRPAAMSRAAGMLAVSSEVLGPICTAVQVPLQVAAWTTSEIER
jgi:hypothetical protein